MEKWGNNLNLKRKFENDKSDFQEENINKVRKIGFLCWMFYERPISDI